MTDPAAVQAEADLEQARADLCEAAVLGDLLASSTPEKLVAILRCAEKYALAQKHYLSVLATLGDGTL